MTTIEEVKDKVLKCTKCELHKTKTKYVFGDGNKTANIMFIGEAPGANEDKQGIPFVGRAGKLFDELLKSIELNRESIYICNILKCRPPNNRNPLTGEVEACTPYLKAQIDLIKPKVICPMGNYASKFILEQFKVMGKEKVPGIGKIHGQVFKITDLYGTTEIIPLYHPAVGMYNEDMKGILLNDIKILESRKG